MSSGVQFATAEELKLKLEQSLTVIKKQSLLMRKCLDSKGKLMDALKHASTFLAELRTSILGPKQYYELYIAVFDALNYLGDYLRENHGSHHLADLYELVQYAGMYTTSWYEIQPLTSTLGNIVPRLYLMITVGTVYMSIKDAPVKEIMKDMMEMCRGVQHPVRGLFLRYYLMQGSRGHLPIGDSEGPAGNLQDSIHFVVTNFIEMNKLWVRLQHQGHSREREKRTKERQELEIVVGSNLVRLSQLEGIDKEYYRKAILPAILEQVVQCRDVIAQEYLLDVVTQVFPDEFHLHTLDLFLTASASLNSGASVRKIILTLVDRLADYSVREAENDDEHNTEEDKVKVYRGIPVNIDLFDIFWTHISKQLESRPDLPIEDVTALCVGITRLSLSCYPNKTQNIDQILEFILKQVGTLRETMSEEITCNILKLLQLLIKAYPRLLTVLCLKNFIPLLNSQPAPTQKTVASDVVQCVLSNKDHIETVEDAEGVFGLVRIIIYEGASAGNSNVRSKSDEVLMGNETSDEVAEDDKNLADNIVTDQSNLSKIVHLLYNKDEKVQGELLEVARTALSEGKKLVRFTYPALVVSTLRLVRRIKAREKLDSDSQTKLGNTFKFLQQIIGEINKADKPEKALRLFVDAGMIADQVGAEEAGYEFYAQAFSLYEERISDSRGQYQAICIIAGALQSSRNFSSENYDTLASKCALYGSKLLKKPDQCRAVYQASHLWWTVEIPALGESEEQQASVFFHDSKRVLECLQRALRVADACMNVAVSVELFVEILNRCLYYFERGNEQITVKFITGLIELIQRNLGSVSAADGTISESPRKHFERTLRFVENQKEIDSRFHRIVWS